MGKLEEMKDEFAHFDDDSYAMALIDYANGKVAMIPLTYEESLELKIEDLQIEIMLIEERILKKYCS